MKNVIAFLLVLVSVNAFADTEQGFIPPNTVISNACIVSNTGVYNGGFEMVPVYEDIEYICNSGYYLPAAAEECVLCLENSYCVGGTYTYDATNAQGILQCPNGLFAPVGMWESAQCGRILHIGGDVLYLRSIKKTIPSLNVMLDDNIFFGNMTTASVPMHNTTQRKLKINYNNATWSVYDDTVNPEQE